MSFAARAIAYSGNSYVAHFGRSEYAFQKIAIGDKLEGVEFLTSIGQQEQGAQTRGIYKVDEMTVTQLVAEHERMMVHFPPNGVGNRIFPVTISAVDPELSPVVVRLIDCRILSLKLDIEATGKASMIEFKMNCRQITWNGRTLNARRGAPTGGALTL